MVEVTKNGKKVLEHPTCGGIIPDDQKEVKDDGNYIYEFNDSGHHLDSYGNYKKQFPGFLDPKKHPSGKCAPCCFSKYHSKDQIARRAECLLQDNTQETSVRKKEEKEKEKEKENLYIIGATKSPLDKERWGYPQLSLQAFFQEISLNCQLSKTDSSLLKPNHACLLRHGVENNSKQSFIACIADALFYTTKEGIPDIKEMKEKIIKAIDIDTFITYQNGNNYLSFLDTSNIKNIDQQDMDKYSDSKLYKKIFKSNNKNSNDNDIEYFKQVISSYENFINFLRSDDEIIDYTYLWDIISLPNKLLNKSGINLVILEILNQDSTNNIELICPTNHYSTTKYEPNWNTLFIIKEDSYYEPIYLFEKIEKPNESKNNITKFFKETESKCPSKIRSLLQDIVSPLLVNGCQPLPSIPKKYNFKQPILLNDLLVIINNLEDYNIKYQILNYQSKVIGVFCEKNNSKGYIPCYPSALSKMYDYVIMNNVDIYQNYNETTSFLKNIYTDSSESIPCKLHALMVEDEMIIGILTETNQMIPLSEPYPSNKISDDIPQLKYNTILPKNILLKNTNVDKKRVKYINKIKMETNFYNVFRNTIRILLNDYKNIKLREENREIIE